MTKSNRKSPAAAQSDDDRSALLAELLESGRNMSVADFKAQQMSYVIGCVAGDDKNAQEKVRQYLEKTHDMQAGT